MPQQVQFIIGEGFDRWGKPISDRPSLEKQAYRLVADAFGGYTSTHSDGGWVTNNSLVEEPSLSIQAIIPDDLVLRVPTIAEQLRALFNQQSVLVTRQKLDSIEYVNVPVLPAFERVARAA